MLASELGNTSVSCGAVGISRSSYYRRRKPRRAAVVGQEKRIAPRALSELERARVVEVLHEERFMDKSPYQIFARLLDENKYVGSVSTMYRCLRTLDE